MCIVFLFRNINRHQLYKQENYDLFLLTSLWFSILKTDKGYILK